MEMIKTQDLAFTYPGTEDQVNTRALRGVDVTIERGSFVVILGHNGSGKSTLAKLIMGIEHPTKGSIFFNGEDITDLSIDERAKRGIGYAFQQPPRFKGMSVRRLLELAHGRPLEEENCISYLSDVGLCSKDYLDRDVDNSLSGGEVKRIEIATLLARELKMSIFDEPEAGIDLWSFSKLVETFQKLHQQKQQDILLISHQERIMQLADEMIVIENGRIAARGSKEEILPRLLMEFEPCGINKKAGVEYAE